MVGDRRRAVLLVEDEPEIRRALVSYLERDGLEVVPCGTRAEALSAYEHSEPDLMLLDITLPDGSGLDLLRRAHDGGRRTPAIMLTARAEEVDRIVGLELGADDYITKPFSPREVVARVHAVLRRAQPRDDSPRTAASAVLIDHLEIDLGAYEVRIGGRSADVTATEFRILRVFAENAGQTFTRAALLDKLNDDGSIYERTLDRHINNLRKKIEPDPANPKYLVTVYGVGYKMKAPH